MSGEELELEASTAVATRKCADDSAQSIGGTLARGRAPRPGAQNVTLREVARHAGVSKSTVSRVCRGCPNVRESTRVHVEGAIRALNFVPNLAARQLASAREPRVGLLFPRGSVGAFGELLASLLNKAESESVHLHLEAYDEDLTAPLEQLLTAGVVGIIAHTPVAAGARVLAQLQNADVPVVALSGTGLCRNISRICIDEFGAGYALVSHLAEQGHRRIALLKGGSDSAAGVDRLAGYQAAMHARGANVDAHLVVPGCVDFASGSRATRALLQSTRRPTAIVTDEEAAAAGAISAAYCLGLSVPHDVSVASFGDTAIAMATWPPLTTVRRSPDDTADAALTFLLRDPRDRPGRTRTSWPTQLTVPYALAQRGSTARASQPASPGS